MTLSRILLVIAALLVLVSTSQAGVRSIPDLSNSIARFVTYTDTEPLVLLFCPDGSGAPLTEARRLGDFQFVDARIMVEIRDLNEDPVAFYPHEDLWLESADAGLAICPGGTVADAQTDAFGQTYWSSPLFAGGHSQSETLVMISGDAVIGSPPLILSYNSPDIDGNLRVSLIDLALFTDDYYWAYHRRSDFSYDGQIDLPDLATFAAAYGASCP